MEEPREKEIDYVKRLRDAFEAIIIIIERPAEAESHKQRQAHSGGPDEEY